MMRDGRCVGFGYTKHETGGRHSKPWNRKLCFAWCAWFFLVCLDLAITLKVKSKCHTASMSLEIVNAADIDVAYMSLEHEAFNWDKT